MIDPIIGGAAIKLVGSLVKDKYGCKSCGKVNFDKSISGSFYRLKCCNSVVCEPCYRRSQNLSQCGVCSDKW